MYEPHNVQGRLIYAVTVKKTGTIMGHLPRRLSGVCLFFLRRGGTISCKETGGRRYSIDLYIALTLTFVYYTVHNSTHVIIVP